MSPGGKFTIELLGGPACGAVYTARRAPGDEVRYMRTMYYQVFRFSVKGYPLYVHQDLLDGPLGQSNVGVDVTV